jgi:DNA polymerase
MPVVTIDFETYSEAGYNYNEETGKWTSVIANRPGLRGVGAYIYAVHRSTRVISLAYDMHDDLGVRLWAIGMPLPDKLITHIRHGKYVEAHNAAFEFYIWNMCFRRYDSRIPFLSVRQLRCSAAKARAVSLPPRLKKLAEVLGTEEQKDTKGDRLIRLLSIPKNRTKTDPGGRRRPENFPAEFAEMYLYNIQDVHTERDVSFRLPDLSRTEQDLWRKDLNINWRGVSIDIEALAGCIREFEKIQDRLTARLREITEGAVQTHNEVAKIIAWLAEQDLIIDTIDKKMVEKLLARLEDRGPVVEVLKIRKTLAASSVKKIYSIRARMDDANRVHDLYAIYGADRTGRFAGRGPQPQNLPGSGPNAYLCSACGAYTDSTDTILPCGHNPSSKLEVGWDPDVVDSVLKDVQTERGLSAWKDPVRAIAGSLRGLFVAAPGCELIGSDYSAIEARVIAELAGEAWRQEVFRGHGKIYEMSGSKITGVPFDQIIKGHFARLIGKVAELASGYQGWINAWKKFGAGKTMSDEEIKDSIIIWRADSPAIVELWGGQWRKDPHSWSFTQEYYGLEGAAIKAILLPGEIFKYRRISYQMRDNALYCRLPSGRELAYQQPSLKQGIDRYSQQPIYIIHFWGWNTNAMAGPVGWIQMQTYGGKLAENVTQAVARDILAAAIIRLEQAGYPIVLHTHDDIVAEVPRGRGSIREFERLMCKTEEWFRGWPIKAAGGWRGKRFRK